MGGRAEGDKLFHIVYIETTGRIRQLVKITLSVFMSFFAWLFFYLIDTRMDKRLHEVSLIIPAHPQLQVEMERVFVTYGVFKAAVLEIKKLLRAL